MAKQGLLKPTVAYAGTETKEKLVNPIQYKQNTRKQLQSAVQKITGDKTLNKYAQAAALMELLKTKKGFESTYQQAYKDEVKRIQDEIKYARERRDKREEIKLKNELAVLRDQMKLDATAADRAAKRAKDKAAAKKYNKEAK